MSQLSNLEDAIARLTAEKAELNTLHNQRIAEVAAFDARIAQLRADPYANPAELAEVLRLRDATAQVATTVNHRGMSINDQLADIRTYRMPQLLHEAEQVKANIAGSRDSLKRLADAVTVALQKQAAITPIAEQQIASNAERLLVLTGEVA